MRGRGLGDGEVLEIADPLEHLRLEVRFDARGQPVERERIRAQHQRDRDVQGPAHPRFRRLEPAVEPHERRRHQDGAEVAEGDRGQRQHGQLRQRARYPGIGVPEPGDQHDHGRDVGELAHQQHQVAHAQDPGRVLTGAQQRGRPFGLGGELVGEGAVGDRRQHDEHDDGRRVALEVGVGEQNQVGQEAVADAPTAQHPVEPVRPCPHDAGEFAVDGRAPGRGRFGRGR